MKTHFDDLRETLDEARLCHEAWWLFIGDHDQQPNITTLRRRYNLSVEVIYPSLFISFIVKLASVFDTRSDCISLERLPHHAQCPKFDETWKRGRILYKFRNKVIAHRDLQVTERNFAAETNFTYDDLRYLLDDACIIFDFCADLISIEKTRRFTSIPNFQRLIQDLATMIQAEQDAAANP